MLNLLDERPWDLYHGSTHRLGIGSSSKDLLIEDTHDWYAQDDDGNVWYMCEEVDNYNYNEDTGELIDVTHEGAWETGLDVADMGVDAAAGIIMPAHPTVGDSYYQEWYRGEAEDMGLIVVLDVDVELESGETYEGCVRTLDWIPIEVVGFAYKFYAPGIGVVQEIELADEEVVQLVSVEYR